MRPLPPYTHPPGPPGSPVGVTAQRVVIVEQAAANNISNPSDDKQTHGCVTNRLYGKILQLEAVFSYEIEKTAAILNNSKPARKPPRENFSDPRKPEKITPT